MQLNYDLHVGSIGGIWTKIIAFLVCIILASLPVTGFIIWWGKKKKGKKSRKNKNLKNQEFTPVAAAALNPGIRRIKKPVRT